MLIFVIITFKHVLEDNVISSLLKVASYTYGPLLGLFAFGIFTKIKIKENLVPLVALLSLLITGLLDQYAFDWFSGYTFGYELLILNGILTLILLYVFNDADTIAPVKLSCKFKNLVNIDELIF